MREKSLRGYEQRILKKLLETPGSFWKNSHYTAENTYYLSLWHFSSPDLHMMMNINIMRNEIWCNDMLLDITPTVVCGVIMNENKTKM